MPPVAARKRAGKLAANSLDEQPVDDIIAEIEENQRARADAVFAPLSFEDEDELPHQVFLGRSRWRRFR